MLVGYKNNNITRAKRTLANWEYLFTFLKYEGVEPTNNIAEHTIRPSVQWRKICFGSQSDTGLRFTERLLSVVGTCRLHGVNPYRPNLPLKDRSTISIQSLYTQSLAITTALAEISVSP